MIKMVWQRGFQGGNRTRRIRRALFLLFATTLVYSLVQGFRSLNT